MKIAFGCDHAGITLRESVLKHLEKRQVDVIDLGTTSTESVDYPDFAVEVSRTVLIGQATLGILICGTGLGMAIAANKIPGIRAVTVSDTFSARMARAHNNANILTFGSRVVGPGAAMDLVDAFLDASYEGGRHQHRLDKIATIEKSARSSDPL